MTDIEFARHTLATLAYRASTVLRDAPAEFATYGSETGRTPAKILAHMGDLFDWALSIVNGNQVWRESTPLEWDAEIARFFAVLTAFDQRLAAAGPLGAPVDRLFQGPIADAHAHLGQLAMLRRLAGCPMHGENYFVADIAVGRTGIAQSAPRMPF